MVSGRVGLLNISIFGGGGGGGGGGGDSGGSGGCGVLMWLVYPTLSVVCLPYYLMFLCFLYFLGSWIMYEMVRFNLDDYLCSMYWHGASSFSSSM